MSIAITAQQKKDFENLGYIILENFLHKEELDRLLVAIDYVATNIRAAKSLGPNDPFAIRNALAHHDAFLDLIDHPRI